MQKRTIPKKNTTSPIISRVHSRVPWIVKSVQPLLSFRISIRFNDGTKGIVDLSNQIQNSKGVFTVLKDPKLFAQVYVQYGAVTWPGELDLAPDAMHKRLKESKDGVIYY